MSNRNFALPRTETYRPLVTASMSNTNHQNNPQGNPTQSKNGLPVWAWILIVVGILLLAALVVLAIWYFTSKNKKHVTETEIAKSSTNPPVNMSVSKV